MSLRLDQRQDFLLDELRIFSGHGVVLQAALAALGIAAAIADGDGNHRRNFMLGNQVVERREQRAVRSIRANDEGSDGAGNILLRNIHSDAARVGRRMAGGHNQLAGLVGSGVPNVPGSRWMPG